MAIQFECPSCHHPIEVDDQWASHAVACPFCERTVTAPAESTYRPPPEVPPARPVAPPMSASPPFAETAEQRSDTGTLAVWAFGLSCLWLLAFICYMVVVSPHIAEIAPAGESAAEVRRHLMERIEKGDIPTWLGPAVLLLLCSGAFWLAGAVCSFVALRRGSRRAILYLAVMLLAIGPVLFLSSIMFAGA